MTYAVAFAAGVIGGMLAGYAAGVRAGMRRLAQLAGTGLRDKPRPFRRQAARQLARKVASAS